MKDENIIADLLGEILFCDPLDLKDSFCLTIDNNVTPVDVAKLAIACEKFFGLVLFDEKIAQWKTLDDVRRHLEKILDEGQAEPTERSDEERLAWYYE